ncbi:MAG: CDP-alcohol phosphatidyltransferase family protein [Betaproteobacteria bacterium]|nr:CDP-alcohol phosphatidyltransferase family protein [Betaproteobacteria bacterium]MCC6247941.1 CDP-alcohol phosphatidyltransferase family protein [Rubrivivax sp.]
MLDRSLLAVLQPPLRWAARRLAAAGVHADAVTLAGFVFGVAAMVAIAASQPLAGLAGIVLSRLADGLDGELARATAPTDRGAFLDITLDFLFYAGVPLAFALADPPANALPAAVLLAAFIGTGSTFLAFAVLAERRGLASSDYPSKGFFYLGGLTEGSETIACFALMCLVPQHFAWWAYGFAAACAVTIGARLVAGWITFGRR